MKTLAEEIDDMLAHSPARGSITPEAKALLEQARREALERETTRCCEAGVRTLRGAEHDGNRWTCSCGKSWMFVEDEAEGGAWHRIENTKPPTTGGQP